MEQVDGIYVLRRRRPVEEAEAAPPRVFYPGRGGEDEQDEGTGLGPDEGPSWPVETEP